MITRDAAPEQQYLRRLDRAARWLPKDRADELRQQVLDHLSDALPPDADEDATAAVLTQLGEPDTLVQEACASRRLRTRIGRLSWWTRLLVVAALAGLVATTVVVVRHELALARYRDASALACECGEWVLYAADRRTEHRVDAGDTSLLEIDARRARQGFGIDVFNRSDVPQTVLGLPAGLIWAHPAHYELLIGAVDDSRQPYRRQTYSTGPVTIPPGQDRPVRFVWWGMSCQGPGALTWIDALPLRVRVGPYVRLEHVVLGSSLGVRWPTHKPAGVPDACS